jgi:Domain of unknown function (DUF4397)
MKVLKSLLLALTLIASISLFTTSCAKDDTTTPPVVTVKDTAKVMFIHAAKGAGNVQFLLDGVKRGADSIAFDQSVPYFAYELPTTKANVAVKAGATVIASDSARSLNKSTGYTYIAYRDSSTDTKVIVPKVLLLLTDGLEAPPANSARVRVVNLIRPNELGQFPIDVDLAGVKTNTSNLGFKAYNQTFENVAAGTKTVKVFAKGTTNISTSKDFAFENGKTYTIVACGDKNAVSLCIYKNN